jgi:WD40 repeat protein
MLILEDVTPFKVHTLAFSPDGRTLASVNGRANRVRLWSLDARKACGDLEGHRTRIVAVAFSGSGEMLVSATSTGQVWLWQLTPSGDPSHRLARQLDWRRRDLAQAPGQIVFAPDGETFATNIQDLSIWGNAVHLVTLFGPRIDLPTGHFKEVACLAFSPDGRFLATGSYDRSVRLHDLQTGRTAMILNQGMKAHYLAFSPDSATLASGSPQGLVKVWDAPTGKKRCTLKGQARPLWALCYSPDGRTIATAGGEGTVAFWDVATSRSRTALDWGIGPVHAVAFAPDGMRAAAGGMGRIVVWDIDDWDF